MPKIKSKKSTPEISLIGEIDDWEADTIKALLEVPEKGECVFYFDSAGGSVYGALAIVNLIRLRQIQGTAVVLSECSSAALLIFAACKRRFVAPYSTFLFHRMRWQSDKRVAAEEAQRWAEHFEKLEADLDELQTQLFGASAGKVREWTQQGQYLTGREIADTGLAELLPT